MKELSALIDTNRDLLREFRGSFKKSNKIMTEYEQQIFDKGIKLKARNARLEFKKAFKKYNLMMEKLRG